MILILSVVATARSPLSRGDSRIIVGGSETTAEIMRRATASAILGIPARDDSREAESIQTECLCSHTFLISRLRLKAMSR